MDKKGVICGGIVCIVLIILVLLLFSPIFSSAILSKDQYLLGEKVKIDLSGFENPDVKITTPSTSYVQKNAGKNLIFEPEELGNYEIIVDPLGVRETYAFEVVEEYKNYSINVGNKDNGNFLEGPDGEVYLGYVNESNRVGMAKVSEDIISPSKKEVSVSSSDGGIYDGLRTRVSLPREVKNRDAIEVYWEEEKKFIDFEVFDENGNGLFDSVEWISPGSDDQNFVIIISDAEHLDENRTFIEDVYDLVKERDGAFAYIPDRDYLRVMFEKNLTSENDITIYAKSSDGARVEVYEKDSDELIADFGVISDDKKYQIFLNNLSGEQDTFDLRVVDGDVEFDYVVDPVSVDSPWWTEGGQVTLAASQTTPVTLSREVDTSKAFILLSRRAAAAQDEPSDSGVYAEWVNGTTFNLRKQSTEAGAIIVWHVIEGNNLYVQNGTQAYTQSQTSFDLTMSSVNVSRTVAFMTFGSCDGTSPANTNEIFWTGNVTSSTNLHIQRDDSGVCDGSVSYFVVEFNDGSIIQQGEISNVGTTSYAYVNTINQSNTWFYFSQASDGTAAGLDDTGVIAEHYNTTAFRVSRQVAGGVTRAQWYAISTPGAYVQYNLFSPMTNNDVTISQVSLNRSFSLISFNNSGAGTVYGNSMGTSLLTTQTNLHLQRGATGNIESAFWQVVQLPLAVYPEITIISPLNQTYGVSIIDFNVSVSEGVDWCGFSLNDGANVSMTKFNTTLFNYSYSGLNDGSHNITFSCNSTLGVFNSTDLRSFSVDTNPPDVTIIFPQNTSYDTNELSINFSSVDPNLDSCWYTDDGGTTNYTLASCQNVSYTAFEGSTTLTVYANDTLLHENSSEVVFFVDSIFPLIDYSSDSYVNGAVITGDDVYINTTVTEDNFANITFYLYDSLGVLRRENTFYDDTRSVTWNLLGDDTYSYNVTVYDIMNRVNFTETRTITLDNVAPVVDFSDGTEEDFANKSQSFVFVNATVTEDNFANITFDLYNSTGQVNSTTFSDSTRIINWTGLSDDTYYYNITVYDLAGQSSSTVTRTITLDTTFPLIDFSDGTAIDGANVSQNFILVNTTVAEDNFANITFDLYNSTGQVNSTTFSDSTRIINWTGLSDGAYFYNVSSSDHAGNVNYTGTRGIGLDTTGPVINIIAPESKAYGYNVSLPLNYTVYDALIGVDSCWWNLDNETNQTIVCGQNTTFDTSEGMHTLYFYSNDSFGHIGNSEVTFSVSTTGPAVVLIFPEDGTFFNQPTEILFNFSAEDPDNVSVCSLFGSWGGWHLNQSIVVDNLTFTGNFSTNISEQGGYLWNVWCNDTIGFDSFAILNFTFSIDTTFPLIDFSDGTAIDGANVSQNFIFVNTTVTEDNFANITFDLFDYNSQQIYSDTFADSTRSVNWPSLSNGIYYYNVTVNDLAGNVNYTGTRKILLDQDDPSVTLENPDDDTYDNNISQNFTANFSDNIELRNVTLFIFNETNYLIYNLTVFLSGVNSSFVGIAYDFLSDGVFNWSYGAYDLAGNSYFSENRTITIDTTLPMVNFTVGTEDNNTYFVRNWLYINTTVVEDNFANITFTLYDGEGPEREVFFTDSTRDLNWTLLSDDTYYYNVTVWDLAGNVNSTETRTITLDNVAPVVDFSDGTEEDFANKSQSFVFVNATVTEDNFANITFDLYNSTGQVNSTTFSDSTRIINWTGLSDDTYYYNITVYDLAGQSSSTVTRTITLDTTFPLIDFVYPTLDNGSEFEGDWIFLNVSFTEDNFFGIDFNLYNDTGGITLVNSTSYNWSVGEINWTNLSSENVTYFYNVSVYDYAGNVNSTEVRTIKLVDLSNPNLVLYSPENTTYNYNTSLSLAYFAEDIHMDSCWYSLDGGLDISIAGCQNTTFSVSDEQSHNLTLYVNDTLGQINSSSVSFFVNTSLIFTNTWSVQRGSDFVDGAQPVSIIQADGSKSFILHTARSSDSGPDSLFVKSDFFPSNDQIEFENYASGVGATVEWEVITGPNLSVQRSTEVFVTTDLEVNVTIGAVNLSESFIIVSSMLNSGTGTDNQRARWTGKFVNSTYIAFRRAISGTAGEISWQVVDWQGANVQNGSFAVSALSGTDSIANAVDLNNTFLIFSSTTNSGTSLAYVNTGGFILDPNTVSFYRQTDDAGFMYAEWFVVETPILNVQRGSFSITGSTPINTPIFPLVNQTRSFNRPSWDSTGGGNTHANAVLTTSLTNTTNLQTIKGTGSQTQNVSWQVIEITELDPPVIDLLYPLNYWNFSSFGIDQFNYTVSDESLVANCSLFGNWTGSWHNNQTVQSPSLDVLNNFSSVTSDGDGFYLWNIECIDSYGNVGVNSTNFTFGTFLFPDQPNSSGFNASQDSNDGTGNVTFYWGPASHAIKYNIYYADNLTSNFTFLNSTSDLNFTHSNFSGNKRMFYRVDAWNPVGQNSSSKYFGVHVYSLRHNGNTRNWIGFPTNASYLATANDSLYEIRNLTSFTMWNATSQKRLTCNTFSCPEFPSCTDTNCDFDLDPGLGYEVNINSSAPSSVNWSMVGVVYNQTPISLVKNSTDFGKNWISMYANTTISNAQGLLENISNSDAVSRWNNSLQTSEGLIYVFGLYIGTNFDVEMESGYEVSVTQDTNWTQV